MAKQVTDMTTEEATALLRPPPKRYKSPSKGRRKAVVAALVQQATENTACILHPLQGLYAILALPAMESNVALRLMEEWQGALCCVMVENSPPTLQQQCLKAPPTPALPDDEEKSPWSTAKLEYSQFDTWLTSAEAQATPPPYKSAIYRMTPEQLQFHKQEIAKLSATGWVGPTYSPICAPTIMVDKRSDGTGERKMRMVVNYQELNALMIAPDFLLPPIQTILEMLGGAQYFSTLGLESGFHQIRMAKKDRWKTAFRSVMGLFEYTVMPFGLKGAPATFQANINAYLQPLLVAALDKWAHLLRATKVTAHTHHQALTHLQQLKASKPLRGLTARRLDFLAEFPDLTITYFPGARNQVADALSRLPCHTTPCPQPSPIALPETPLGSLAALGLATDPPDPPHKTHRLPETCRSPPAPLSETLSFVAGYSPAPCAQLISQVSHAGGPVGNTHPRVLDWPAASCKCPVFSEPYHTASSMPGEVVRLEFQHRRHTFRYVLPYLRICANGLWLICVPQFPEFLTHVLYTHHDHVTAGYRGQKKTYTAISKHYCWPGMRTYTNAYAESCTQCRASKSLNQKPAGLLQQLLIPSRRWSHVSLDFVTDLPLTTAGYNTILVVADSLSKMAHFIPAKKSHSAADTVELLADRLIRYHGFPDVLVSDRDPHFQSEVRSQLCSRFNSTQAMSSSYHPQTDGQTEQVNRTLEQMLRTYVQADEREWDGLLPALELAYNTTSHSSTELSPFEIMIGENPLTAADLDIVGALAPTLTPPMTKLFRQLGDRAQSHILKAKWRQKYYADAHRHAVEYKVGDQLWLSSKHLPALNHCSKFEPKLRCPFTVTERIGKVAYRLALPPTYEGHNVFHVSQLLPHRPRAPALVPQEAPVGWPPTRDEAGNPADQYLVDYILDQKGTGEEAYYLVRWRGVPEERAT
ncbi:hypothetical protein EBH_0067040 [Eimeria brunetti]|uniref:Integrase catalytic domain-containing protein n=1 Tax=Eimeria brunetti TaxID=51314 RepID=U6LFJ7_9EIME|nr:hypothetical protein EBH_0067040 [Eimeria brunetti]